MKFNFSIKVISSILLFIAPYSCHNNDIQQITINRFDKDAMQYTLLEISEKETFKQKYNSVLENYIDLIYPDTTISIDSKMESFENSNAIKLFYPKVDSVFYDNSKIENDLSVINQNLESILNIALPHIYTAIIPYNQSIIVTEEDIIIGLNHYLGADYPPYSDFPEYKRRFKTIERLKYDVCESILRTAFPFQRQENTFLEYLIYEGTIAHALELIVPNYKAPIALKFTEDQLNWCKTNETNIWNEIISTNILYSTKQEYKNAFFTPAPFTKYFSNSSPGELGKWVGKQIIRKYLDETDTSIKDILLKHLYQNSQSFLISSQYNGK